MRGDQYLMVQAEATFPAYAGLSWVQLYSTPNDILYMIQYSNGPSLNGSWFFDKNWPYVQVTFYPFYSLALYVNNVHVLDHLYSHKQLGSFGWRCKKTNVNCQLFGLFDEKPTPLSCSVWFLIEDSCKQVSWRFFWYKLSTQLGFLILTIILAGTLRRCDYC